MLRIRRVFMALEFQQLVVSDGDESFSGFEGGPGGRFIENGEYERRDLEVYEKDEYKRQSVATPICSKTKQIQNMFTVEIDNQAHQTNM